MNHWYELVRLCLEIYLTAQQISKNFAWKSYSPTDIYKLLLEIHRVSPQISVLDVVSIIVRMSASLFVPASPIIKSEASLGKWES